jgi:hypothetical protein
MKHDMPGSNCSLGVTIKLVIYSARDRPLPERARETSRLVFPRSEIKAGMYAFHTYLLRTVHMHSLIVLLI